MVGVVDGLGSIDAFVGRSNEMGGGSRAVVMISAICHDFSGTLVQA